jgi:hypothetical protein
MIEKFFDCYNRYRGDFESRNAFIEWYNTVQSHERWIRSGIFKRRKRLSVADYLWR